MLVSSRETVPFLCALLTAVKERFLCISEDVRPSITSFAARYRLQFSSFGFEIWHVCLVGNVSEEFDYGRNRMSLGALGSKNRGFKNEKKIFARNHDKNSFQTISHKKKFPKNLKKSIFSPLVRRTSWAIAIESRP